MARGTEKVGCLLDTFLFPIFVRCQKEMRSLVKKRFRKLAEMSVVKGKKGKQPKAKPAPKRRPDY